MKFQILVGTKWCGTGDIAKNDTDFGTFLNVDRCCQAHDKCPDYISGFQTKYNLTNPVFHTRLHCSCDMEFYNCLKKINTPIALKVGLIFFNLLNNQCYKEDYPYKCISRLIIP
ncbi:phospholipase A(2)-like [Diorhabda carinulata]|uniref:phospholipase A(2)-like n=1 Tax=Diorhabda carinulata TaxID=1163345 RepID=UPI0025A0B650|nr:phospholipase A(2)-like [Diorhabda carinulata]